MRALAIVLIGLVSLWPVPLAAGNDECAVVAHLVPADYPLPSVKRAIAEQQLNIVVVGSASSLLAGPGGKQEAYPSRLEAVLSKQLPGVKIKVTTYAKPRTTAEAMEQDIERIVSADKPALLIWQTGTVDAIRGVDTESFRSAIEDGVETAKAGNSDVILMNPQYSPRTESMIGIVPYVDAMRFVALQHEIPLFDRFAVMHQWVELGTFDLMEATKKTDTAEHVHQCIAELLANLIVQSAHMTASGTQDHR